MRYFKYFFLVVIFCTTCVSILNASGINYQSLGISASSYSGSGLSYRYHFENKWSLQITGGAFIDSDTKAYATGIEIQNDLSSRNDKRLFLIMALGVYGDTEEIKNNYNEYSENSNNVDDYFKENVSYYKVAVGFGGELAFGDEIIDHLTLGLSIYPIGFSIKEKHSYPGYDNADSVSFGASIYTHFNF